MGFQSSVAESSDRRDPVRSYIPRGFPTDMVITTNNCAWFSRRGSLSTSQDRLQESLPRPIDGFVAALTAMTRAENVIASCRRRRGNLSASQDRSEKSSQQPIDRFVATLFARTGARDVIASRRRRRGNLSRSQDRLQESLPRPIDGFASALLVMTGLTTVPRSPGQPRRQKCRWAPA